MSLCFLFTFGDICFICKCMLVLHFILAYLLTHSLILSVSLCLCGLAPLLTFSGDCFCMLKCRSWERLSIIFLIQLDFKGCDGYWKCILVLLSNSCMSTYSWASLLLCASVRRTFVYVCAHLFGSFFFWVLSRGWGNPFWRCLGFFLHVEVFTVGANWAKDEHYVCHIDFKERS